VRRTCGHTLRAPAPAKANMEVITLCLGILAVKGEFAGIQANRPRAAILFEASRDSLPTERIGSGSLLIEKAPSSAFRLRPEESPIDEPEHPAACPNAPSCSPPKLSMHTLTSLVRCCADAMVRNKNDFSGPPSIAKSASPRFPMFFHVYGGT
jgi:hypothetical protein